MGKIFILITFSFLWAMFFVGASKLYISYKMYSWNQISTSEHIFHFIALISFGSILISETKKLINKWEK